MGISWSSNKRRTSNYYHNPYHHPHPHLIASSSSSSSYSYASESYPYPAPTPYAYPAQPLPPPPVPPICPSHYYYGGYSACNYANPTINRPPGYVDHQEAKKVRNDVNVHKDSLRLLADSQNPDHYLVSFDFDALFDGR
ncbi:unnamed protein product [Thlaspi arvense]|uniref:RING-type E3 ubiquitin transferase n=1 Tax=Thlaspi arvense TaxID=13288 RepID=A0AAU9RS02_THLAR|nr:unnamed protein product [Thlaspi arvense]